MKNKFMDMQNSSYTLNPQELKVLFFLLAKSNKSDRAMAKALGISNASLSKRRKKLEKEGYINQYTIIPNLGRLGFELVIFHFASTSGVLSSEQIEDGREFIKKYPQVLCLLEERSHRGTSWFAITIHKNYDDFMKMSKEMQEDIISTNKTSDASHYERHTFLFHTDKPAPSPFSFRNLEILFQSTSQMNQPRARK